MVRDIISLNGSFSIFPFARLIKFMVHLNISYLNSYLNIVIEY